MATAGTTAQRAVRVTMHEYTRGLSAVRQKRAKLPTAIQKQGTVSMWDTRPGVALSVLVRLFAAQDAGRLELGQIARWQRWSVPLRPQAQP